MGGVITSILTDGNVRSVASVEQALTRKVEEAAGAWY
jgi:hypothetical protein